MKKFVVSSSWSTAIGAVFIAAFALVGCGDDSSASAGPKDEPISVENSSSSKKLNSSSSVIASEAKLSSCSSAESSSSKDEKKTKASSSSVKSNSSSSVIPSNNPESSSCSVEVPPTSSETESSFSSSEDKVNCSALLEGKTGWSWDVPKECRFNPNIDYGTMTDERDGKVYRTVKIGDQVWMAENLNYYDDSDLSVKEKSWCFGKVDVGDGSTNGDSSTCDIAGRLYTWAAAIDSAKLYTDKSIDCGDRKICIELDTVYGICPPGWHLPNNTEWSTLLTTVGGNSTAAKVLKSRTGWYGSNKGRTDAYAFSALPAGYRNYYGAFMYDGSFTYFWSSTENDSLHAYNMGLYTYSYEEHADLYSYGKGYGFSVRCVKN